MNAAQKAEADANGTGPAPVGPPTPPEDGVIRLQLTPEGWQVLADKAWAYEEYNAGRWAPYGGEYIAVHRKQLSGHGPDRLKLREDVARETGFHPDRIVIIYVEPPFEC